jgi:Tfp pilus assembly protein PilN
MSRSQQRIQKKEELEKKYEDLMREKQIIENRVQEKKEYNKRLETLKREISCMKDE